MLRCGRYNQHVKRAAALLLAASGALMYGAEEPGVIGAVTSTSPIIIGKTSMSPAAAPSWPVVERDEIETTTAPAFLVTPEQNRVVLDPGAAVNARKVESGELYIYLRKGGLSFNAKSRRIYICAGGSLYVARSPASGIVRLEQPGSVFDRLDSGKFEEKGKRVCNDQGVMAYLTAAAAGGGAVTGAAGGAGVASAGAAVSGATAGGIVAGAATLAVAGAGVAGTVAATSFVAASASSTCGATGCNFNPPPVSVSGP